LPAHEFTSDLSIVMGQASEATPFFERLWLDPAIHVFAERNALFVDARDKRGHDGFCVCLGA